MTVSKLSILLMQISVIYSYFYSELKKRDYESFRLTSKRNERKH